MPTTQDDSLRRQVTSNHWGPGVAETRNGKLIRVCGHKDDPDPSNINDNLADVVNGKSRIRRPAVRKSYLEKGPGSDNQRGLEPFVEVSWDTALDLAAKALSQVRATHGNEAIFGGSYGWSSAGRFHHAQSQLKRFLNCTGGFVRSEGNYSYNAALGLMPHIVGNFRDHVKQATRWSSVARHGQLVVMFGGIPLRNAQVGGGGLGRHQLRDDLLACKAAGVEFINLSPLQKDAMAELEATWQPIIPGSDTAVMMALAQTLLEEGLCDRDFLETYTVGFSRFEAYLSGKVDGIAKTAEWAAPLSGIEAETLRALARNMATRRTLLCTAVGLQRAEHGEQPLWMTVTLAAMLGQIGLPGGGYGIGYGGDASIGTTDRPMRWPTLSQGHNPVETFIPVATIADMLLEPGTTFQYNGKTLTFPDIRLVWWAGGNPFHHHQDLNRLHTAFQAPETIIVNEIHWTATAKHADIVLPATSTLEREDIGAGTQDRFLIPMPRVIDPVGEARDEYDIFRDLARRLGCDDEFSEGKSSREWLEDMWQTMCRTAAGHGRELPDLNTFLSGDMIEFEDPDPEHVFLSEFRDDPASHPLPTPSGKIEIYSEVIAGFDYADCPGHPTWLPPKEWLGSPKAQEHPLHLISGQPETRLHSQLDPGRFSMSHKVQGREPVMMHPEDAAARGISDGDIVKLHNSRGACLAGAVVTDKVMRHVVFLWTGAWYDPDRSDNGASTTTTMDKHGNPNVLTHDRRTSRLTHGTAAHSTLVEVSRFEGPLPVLTAHEPPLAG